MTTPTTLIQHELALEDFSIELGADIYRKALMAANQKSDGREQFTPERRAIDRYMQPFLAGTPDCEGLVTFMTVPRAAGRGYKVRKYLVDQDPIEIAYVVLRTVFNSIKPEGIPITEIVHTLGSAVMDHISFKDFKKADPEYFRRLTNYLKSESTHHQRTAIKSIANRSPETAWTTWPVPTQRAVGEKLLSILVGTTGMAQRVQLPAKTKGHQGVYTMVLEPELLTILEAAHDHLALCQPVRFPMVVPPLSWDEAGQGGGHLMQSAVSRYSLVRRPRSAANVDHLLENHQPITTAVNHLQGVQWAINSSILDVIHTLKALGNGTGGVPTLHKECLFQDIVKPWNTNAERDAFRSAHPEAYGLLMRQFKDRHDQWAKETTKRTTFLRQLMVSDRLRDYEGVWFCYRSDWRGRINAVQNAVTPQGNDIGKALIRFAIGKPLGSGVDWWKLHGAGTFAEKTPDIDLAVDKLAFQERIDWVDRHASAIIDSGLRPLDGQGFWLKADKPLQFLAWCMEFAQYVQEGMSPSFVSHTPVALDGSCSGLQHMSAALRDEICAAYVNLTTSVSPEDVYRRVAEAVAPKVAHDAANGQELARLWDGVITRKFTKSAVMTFVYGARDQTYTKQLMDLLAKAADKGKPIIKVEDDQRWHACDYLKDQITVAMREVIVKGSELMDWFREVAGIFGSLNMPLWWRTPDDVVVHQPFSAITSNQVRTYWGASRYKARIQQPSERDYDARAQSSGLTPNWVHSLDACHLRTVVNRFMEVPGRSLAVIHDSFGTHAADAPLLSEVLRSTFHDQYRADHIERFLEDVTKQLPPEEHHRIPPRPMPGSWDPESMTGAVYSFL